MREPAATSLWARAHRQARAIGKTRTAAGRRRAVLTWCRHTLAALHTAHKGDPCC
jgi:hypothetical protein